MSYHAHGGDPTDMAGSHHHGAGGLGWTGADVPVSGAHFASLLYNDVVANGWQANEVRWRLTDFGTLPSLEVGEDSSIYHPVLPDGTYTATGIVSVDGVDVGTSVLTVIWGTVLGNPRRIVYMQPLKRTVTDMRRAEILEDMDVSETDTVRFDYSNTLAAGETLANTDPADAVVSVEVYSGVDATPSAIFDGSRQVSGSYVQQGIRGPQAGVVYLLRCRAKTSINRYLTRACYIKGIREGA